MMRIIQAIVAKMREIESRTPERAEIRELGSKLVLKDMEIDRLTAELNRSHSELTSIFKAYTKLTNVVENALDAMKTNSEKLEEYERVKSLLSAMGIHKIGFPGCVDDGCIHHFIVDVDVEEAREFWNRREFHFSHISANIPDSLGSEKWAEQYGQENHEDS